MVTFVIRHISIIKENQGQCIIDWFTHRHKAIVQENLQRRNEAAKSTPKSIVEALIHAIVRLGCRTIRQTRFGRPWGALTTLAT